MNFSGLSFAVTSAHSSGVDTVARGTARSTYGGTTWRDSPFWIDNTDPSSIPQTLQDKLAQWKHRPPHRLDFVSDLEMFLVSSWQYVLYGMEFKTDLSAMRNVYPRVEEARQEFRNIQLAASQALHDLPDHRALVEQMCREYRERTGAERAMA